MGMNILQVCLMHRHNVEAAAHLQHCSGVFVYIGRQALQHPQEFTDACTRAKVD